MNTELLMFLFGQFLFPFAFPPRTRVCGIELKCRKTTNPSIFYGADTKFSLAILSPVFKQGEKLLSLEWLNQRQVLEDERASWTGWNSNVDRMTKPSRGMALT